MYITCTLVTTCGDMGIIAPEVYLILLPNNSVHVYTTADADQKVIWQRRFIYIFVLYIMHMLATFCTCSSLKQQSKDRHVGPLGNIILIPCQPVFAQK